MVILENEQESRAIVISVTRVDTLDICELCPAQAEERDKAAALTILKMIASDLCLARLHSSG